MNFFENLIDELKEENLLEETVIETRKAPASAAADDEFLGAAATEKTDFRKDSVIPPAQNRQTQAPLDARNAKTASAETTPEIVDSAEKMFLSGESFPIERYEEQKTKRTIAALSPTPPAETGFSVNFEDAERQPINEQEFYRKRAVEEVSCLQMVEHVLSGVEREQMKTLPKTFNDIAAKKALHDFLQISGDAQSPEHAQAEFQLMQETETWCSALSYRDRAISVAHLRRYCETTRPPLSSQALIALARFYRNLPYTEPVRGKFDLVVTRLFTKDIGGEKRILVFSREELIEHLKELYAEWSSIPLYSTDPDDSDVLLAALKFEDFMTEAESADDFDELVKNDFFNRLRLFKDEINEIFYAPLITATAVECNVRIGNKYVELIENERHKSDADDLQERYGFLHDQAISDAASKTLQLVELLKGRTEEIETIGVEAAQERSNLPKPSGKSADAARAAAAAKASSARAKVQVKNKDVNKEKGKTGLFAVNRWLLAATVIVAVASGALYYWANFMAAQEQNVSGSVKKVNLENSSLKEYLQTARISGDTFYGVTLPSWDALTLEKKEEALKKIFSSGSDKGYTKVHLLNKEGKAVGYASAEKAEVITP